VARLIGASHEEIAYVASTTHGIGLVAEGFPWREGDNVVTAAEEYPSNLYPWMNLADRGVGLRTVPSRDGRVWIEDLADAMDDRTRVLTISHVEWSSGFRNDLDALGELCRSRGVALFVDAIQGLGPLTIDVSRTPIDFLAADGHKWLLGPEGAGFLFVRREWIERLRPLGVGWHSVVGSYNDPRNEFRLKPSAQRWEGGSFNMPGLQAFGTSVKLFHEIGPEAVSARILDRAEAVRERARSAGWTVVGSARPGDLSGIVALTRDGVDPDAFARTARERGVALASRRGRVRISPHLYNNGDDLDRLADVLTLRP
jgi:selenocysteine lyase/cysteine desulfurase